MGKIFVGVWFDEQKIGFTENKYFLEGIKVATFKDFKDGKIVLVPNDVLIIRTENESSMIEWLELLEESKSLVLIISCPCHAFEKKEILKKYNVDILDSELIKDKENIKKNIGKLYSLVFNRGLLGNIRFISESKCRLSCDYPGTKEGDLFSVISNLLAKSRS